MKLLSICARRTLPLFLTLLLAPAAQAFEIKAGELALTDGTDAKDQPLYVLTLRGDIAYPLADNLDELVAKMKPKQRLLFRLDSRGGSHQQGTRMVETLKNEKAKGREIFTSVENGDTCGSMCVPLFMQGKRRYGGEGSLFMFHGATRPEITNVPDASKTEEVIEEMAKAGLSREWIEARRTDGVFTKPGAYWISGKELFDARAQAITHIIPRHVTEEPWSAPVDPNIRSR